MKTNAISKLLISLVLLTSYGVASAQDAANDQADVWAAVEAQWNAAEKGDKNWPDRMLTDDFSGWGKDAPAPRSKSSTNMWFRFGEEMGKMLAHELYPLSIVVNGDVAVAHYLYSSAYKPKDAETKMRNGRYTDVLVRTDEGWKFIAWHGGVDE